MEIRESRRRFLHWLLGSATSLFAAKDANAITWGFGFWNKPQVGGFAIFGGGDGPSYAPDYAVADRYTYSSNAVAPGTNLGTARRSMNTAGNSTVGIFSGGCVGGLNGAALAVTDQ